MTPLKSLVVAGLTTALCAIAGAASAFEISCPVPDVRREIVTPLPGGWWQTPIVNGLTDTAIVDIGGQPALQCRYGPAGVIQRQKPPLMACIAHPGGFSCTPPIPLPPPPMPIPPTTSSGPVNLQQTYLVDFDNGAITTGPGADLWFEAVNPMEMYLAPRNGAEFALGDRSNRGYLGCSHESYSPARIPLFAAPVGSYICVRTNQGHVSQFRVNGVNPGYPKVLLLGYTTW